MNRFEKNILESEMGLDRVAAIREGEEADGAIQPTADETAGGEELLPLFSADEGEQLKIDDAFLGSDKEEDFFLYGYQDELDLSSLKRSEEKQSDTSDKDGSRLYAETVALIESPEIELEDGNEKIGHIQGGVLTVSKEKVILLSGEITWI